LLDGYNITSQIAALVHRKPEEARLGLVGLIESRRPQGSTKNTVTIVFDGHKSIDSQENYLTVKVLFSRDRTADDRIKSIVEESSNSKNIIVITDDRDIQYAVRALGAKVQKVNEFLAKLKPEAKQKGKRVEKNKSEPASKYISKTLEHDINEQMKKIWLKEKD